MMRYFACPCWIVNILSSEYLLCLLLKMCTPQSQMPAFFRSCWVPLPLSRRIQTKPLMWETLLGLLPVTVIGIIIFNVTVVVIVSVITYHILILCTVCAVPVQLVPSGQFFTKRFELLTRILIFCICLLSAAGQHCQLFITCRCCIHPNTYWEFFFVIHHMIRNCGVTL